MTSLVVVVEAHRRLQLGCNRLDCKSVGLLQQLSLCLSDCSRVLLVLLHTLQMTNWDDEDEETKKEENARQWFCKNEMQRTYGCFGNDFRCN